MPASTSSKPYRVGRSKTGLGLFATQPIKKGTKIIRYFGPMLDCKKKKDDAIENKYLFQITKRWTVDGSVRENIARYINHACKPNAESDVSEKKRKIVIRAIKNIEPGQEINYDYGTDYFKEYLKPIGCKCDACEKKRAKKKVEARAEKQKARDKEKRKAERKTAARGAKAKASPNEASRAGAAKPGSVKAGSARATSARATSARAVAGKTSAAQGRKSVSKAKSAAPARSRAKA
jgi:hypothetical protein